MNFDKLLGLGLIAFGIFWGWVCFKIPRSKSVFKYYSITKDVFTVILIILLGIFVFFGKVTFF